MLFQASRDALDTRQCLASDTQSRYVRHENALVTTQRAGTIYQGPLLAETLS